MKLGIVCAGGELPTDTEAQQWVPDVVRAAIADGDAVTVAADSGLDLAEHLGLAVDLLVGDLDSVSSDALERARAAGVPIEEHPPDKSASDLELAISAVVQRGVDRLIILGGAGGRLDHLLISISVLCGAAQQVPVEAWLGSQHLAVVTNEWAGELATGTTLTVMSWNGPAVVTITGVRWPLDRHELAPISSLGLSNESTEPTVKVTVHSGTVLMVIPHLKATS